MSKFFAHLLFTDSIGWDVLRCVRLNEEDTTSSSRIFIKILFQELAEYMGLVKFNNRLKDPTLAEPFAGIFPRDNPKNTRFSINFFTSIGLGGLTDELRDFLKNAPKQIVQPVAAPVPEEEEKDDADGSSSSSSSSSSDSSSSSSDSSSDWEDDRPKKKKDHRRKKDKNSKSDNYKDNRSDRRRGFEDRGDNQRRDYSRDQRSGPNNKEYHRENELRSRRDWNERDRAEHHRHRHDERDERDYSGRGRKDDRSSGYPSRKRSKERR